MLRSTTTREPEEEVSEGFRPTDQELATHFLKQMLLGYYCLVSKIPVIDIYKYEPWELPCFSGLSLLRSEWYFFCPRHDKNSSRSRRQTEGGFWKSTGQDRVIKDQTNEGLVFKKKSLVYHKGRSSSGTTTRGNWTNWTIHEIRAIHDGTTQGDYVICKLIKKPDKKGKVPTDSEGEPSSRMASEYDHLRAWNSNLSITTSGEGYSSSSSYRETGDVEGEPLFPKDFEIQYPSSFDGNYAPYSTAPEHLALEQQSQVSFMGYNEQGYGLSPIPQSVSVFDYGYWS